MKLKTTLIFIYACFFILVAAEFARSQTIGCQAAKDYKALASIYYSSENLRSDTFDVLKYTINLEIGTSGNQVIAGNTVVKFNPKMNNRNFIRLDLLKLTIDSVKENNTLLTHTYNDTILKVNFTTPKNIGNISDVSIFYHGQPKIDATGWGGFYFDNTQNAEYAFNLGVGFGAKPHNYGRVWFPCFDNFVERSQYEFNITNSLSRVSYCNGQLISDNIQGNKRTRKWVLNEEIPSYLACVSVAEYAQVNWTVNTLSGIKPITLAAAASDTTLMKTGFVNLKSCVNAFENFYGPYMWNRVGYALVPFGNGAMEHATNITYPRNFAGNMNVESDLMAHELAHHWWGDLITCETQEDMWINEGMATFSGYLFSEWQYGKTKYLNSIKNTHEDLLHFLHKNENGFRAVSGLPHSLTYGDHVYKKGADVAHTLRSYMGDSAFFKAIKYTMQQKAFSSINSLELKNLLQTSSGQNLNYFFNDWIFGGGWSHFAIDSVIFQGSGSSVTAVVSIKQKLYGANHLHQNVPLEISFFKHDWSRTIHTVTLSGASSVFTINLNFNPVYTALNYDSKINDASSHEVKVIKTNSSSNWTLGKVNTQVKNKGADSSLVRIIHNYVAPDNFKINPKQHKLSNQHYWKVEGILSPGFVSKIRFNYDGSKNLSGANAYLDTLLAIVNGDSIGLFYRPNAQHEWTWLRKAFKYSSSTKAGYIEVDTLKLGEYTFGNIADTTSLNVLQSYTAKPEVKIYPNPSKQIVHIEFADKPASTLKYSIYDLAGREQSKGEMSQKKNELQIGHLTRGNYIIEIRNVTGVVYTGKLVLEN